MNNTKKTLSAIAVILITAALVVGGTLAATTPSTAFAFQKKPGHNDGKKGAQDNSNSRNGNTITIQKCKQAATQSGFDNTQEQECANLLCTHPGSNATCVSEGAAPVTPVTPVTPNPTPGEVGCPSGTLYDVTLDADLTAQVVAGDILCLFGSGNGKNPLGNQDAVDITPPSTGITGVVAAQPNKDVCNNSGGNSGFVLANVESGDPGNPIGPYGTVCVKENPS